jgi:DNA polymerase IIIc chi subunit
MARVDFYHLTRFPLLDALPKLLERTLAAGQRAVGSRRTGLAAARDRGRRRRRIAADMDRRG